MSAPLALRLGAVAFCGTLVVTAMSGPASAADDTDDFASATEVVGGPPAVVNDGLDVLDGTGVASFSADDVTLTLEVPAAERVSESSTTTVLGTGAPGDTVAVEAAGTGVRALVRVDGPDSPERFDFVLGGDVVELELLEDGSVATLGSDGSLLGVVAAPWAVDADGQAAPTAFKVYGTTLVQVIEHRGGDFRYGIVADPWWNPFSWPWGKWVKKAKKTVVSALKKCGRGALVGALGLGVGTGTTNVLIEKFGKGAKIKVAGGPWANVGAAAAGCIVNQL